MKGKKQRKLLTAAPGAEVNSLLGGGLLFSGHRVKCLSILVLMLIAGAVSLGAEDYVRFSWYSQDETVSQYRWQTDAAE